MSSEHLVYCTITPPPSGLNHDLRSEVGRLTGEKAGLEREVAKLREQVTVRAS